MVVGANQKICKRAAAVPSTLRVCERVCLFVCVCLCVCVCGLFSSPSMPMRWCSARVACCEQTENASFSLRASINAAHLSRVLSWLNYSTGVNGLWVVCTRIADLPKSEMGLLLCPFGGPSKNLTDVTKMWICIKTRQSKWVYAKQCIQPVSVTWIKLLDYFYWMRKIEIATRNTEVIKRAENMYSG